MKAIVIDANGGSDRLRLDERPEPGPAAGEILVRVRAAGVNPVDWKIRRGDLRLVLWLRFPYIPGGDIAGEVVEVGPGVTRFKMGDPVVAFVGLKSGGGYAERAVVKESAAALKSGSLGFAEAASLPIAGVTALQALRDVGGLKEGGSALIVGAAGGVGHFAVQIA
jgi:NADPH:quinone reductase-like Zn-dependent oxidoreductase